MLIFANFIRYCYFLIIIRKCISPDKLKKKYNCKPTYDLEKKIREIVTFLRGECSLRKDKEFGNRIIAVGSCGILFSLLLAEAKRYMEMIVFHNAYANSYYYLREYPLAIFLVVNIVFIFWGILVRMKRNEKLL